MGPKAAGQYDALVQKALSAHQQSRYAEAIVYYDQLIELDPNVALAYYNRGMARYMTGAVDGMRADFQRALQLDTSNAEMLHKIALILVRTNDFISAIQLLQKALELEPDNEQAWLLLASAHLRMGNTEVTRSLYAHLAQKFPNNPVVKLQQAYLLPPIVSSWEEIHHVCGQFMGNLDRLMAEGFQLSRPELQATNFPFYHAYYGVDTLPMARKLSAFFLSACPSLRFTAPHCGKPRQPRDKIRIGFVSEFMDKVTLNQFWLSLINGLAMRGDMEVTVFSDSPANTPAVAELSRHNCRYMQLDEKLETSRALIATEEIDILVYMEIGMAQHTYFLAHARLAHVQCVMAGHPVTSGIETIDHYLAAKHLDPQNGQAHYTENLLVLERPPIVFSRLAIPETIPSREALGLPGVGEATLYCCPVMLFKLHPDMDSLFADILAQDPKAMIVVFDSAYKTWWKTSLEKRFAAHMPAESCARIRFMPHVPANQFLPLLMQMDAILDCLHFSFGTTAYICMSANLPFVTLPGEFARGRGAYALYRYLEIDDMIARDSKDYVRLAIRLANDRVFKESVAEKIRDRSEQLFNDRQSTILMADALRRLVS